MQFEMNIYAKTLLAGLALLPVSCAAGSLSGNEINFNVVESQSLFFSDDQMQQKAQDYLNAHFPPGYSIAAAMTALTKAGATCYYQIDPADPTGYFCDYSRPGHGIYYLFETIDWGIALNFNADKKTIKDITVSRYGTSL